MPSRVRVIPGFCYFSFIFFCFFVKKMIFSAFGVDKRRKKSRIAQPGLHPAGKQKKKEERDHMKEINRLRKELEEARKENEFLKKAAAFFAKEID